MISFIHLSLLSGILVLGVVVVVASPLPRQQTFGNFGDNDDDDYSRSQQNLQQNMIQATIIPVSGGNHQYPTSSSQSQERYPSTVTGGSSEFTKWHNETRIRDREMRLMAIRQYVLNTLGHGKPPPPPSASQLTQQMSRPINNPSSPFSGKLESFFASCELPNNVEVEAWKMPGSFHIFFNLSTFDTTANQSLPSPSTTQPFNPFQTSSTQPPKVEQASTSLNVISAKLKLYKKGTNIDQQEILVQTPTDSKPCNDTNGSNNVDNGISSASIELPTPSTNELIRNSLNFNRNFGIDERIRVSIYWYTIPVTKHHYKKKLLDTKMLSVKDAEWVEFDVQKAAKEWLSTSSHNYGFTIEVENEDDDLIDANKVFSNVFCTMPTNSTFSRQEPTPSPSVLSTPILEICTLSVPSSQQSSTNPFANLRNTGAFPMSHDESSRRGGSPFPWQDDGDYQRGQQQQQQPHHHHHRRRHHHGEEESSNNGNSRGRKNFPASSNENSMMMMQSDDATNVETTTKFELGANHPLRHIFATASTAFGRNNRNGHGNKRKYFRHRSPISNDLDSNNNDDNNNNNQNSWSNGHSRYDDDNNNNNEDSQAKRVIIENIFVEPSSSSSSSSRQSFRTISNNSKR